MTSVFISHSAQDVYFVELLLSLLDYHGIPAWCSTRSIPPGGAYKKEIADALKSAKTMLVVVSRHAQSSKWVTQEIAAFMSRADARVIPIRLDDTDPRTIVDGLEDLESIHFFRDMRLGFELLFGAFDKEFLPQLEHRKRSEPRRPQNRRKDHDRRITPVLVRMRKKFVEAFSAHLGAQLWEDIDLSARTLMKLEDSLLPEAKRYRYTDSRGRMLDPQTALGLAIKNIAKKYHGTKLRAVYLPEFAAEELTEKFNARYTDRRQQSRRLPSDRRERKDSSGASTHRSPTSAEAQYKSPFLDGAARPHTKEG